MNTQPGILDGVELVPADEVARAAIVSVGSELLLGDLTDTNATWLSSRLRDMGVEVVHHVAVRDDTEEFVQTLRWLAGRVHVVICGGGLGPTSDDRTREAVAAAAGVEIDHHDDLEEAIVQKFASMGRAMPPQNARQAGIPRGGRPFPPVGTAPGFALTITDPGPVRVYALPGVPWELKELFHREVAPELQAIAGARATVTRVVHVIGKGESDVAGIVEPIVEGHDAVELSFLARSHEIQVRLTVSGSDADAARAASQPLLEEVIDALGGAVAGLDEEQLEDVVLRLLGDADQTVATAESATAGDIAARLGLVPGASHGLLGGMAVYDTEVKHDVLGVDRGILDEHGPVSEAVTRELARLARERFGADWGVGVTGCAGPEQQNGQPVGTAFWALAHPDGHVEVHTRLLPGDRGQVIKRLGSAALDLLRRRLLER
ncbi:CinA family nicotinamide mononucleotide deamidase-related protein [Egicoccus sp. AB-alg6-2]|uniref:CinA family nicotinamide mononucleotide deamidase-related protein n=1 Tax=Egicoccus sp. AB-alg6-2 TaxID=3242692 RepID=UPI00359D4A29